MLTYLAVLCNMSEKLTSLFRCVHRLSEKKTKVFDFERKTCKCFEQTFLAGKYCLAEPRSSTSKSPKNSNSCLRISKPGILDRIGKILDKDIGSFVVQSSNLI